MKKIPDIINRLWNVCGQMEVGTLLTCSGSGIKQNIIINQQIKVNKRRQEESQQIVKGRTGGYLMAAGHETDVPL